jgi:hypothetical protein
MFSSTSDKAVQRGTLVSTPSLHPHPEVRDQHTKDFQMPCKNNKVERGYFFSAPCLDPEVRREFNSVHQVEVDKGILLSVAGYPALTKVDESYTSTQG